MKTKILIVAILISSCLTSWAWFPKSITHAKVNQIRVGQTTEADLLRLFGRPATRTVDLGHYTALDWFRSVPPPPSGYLPVIGSFLGGLNVRGKQLYVILSPSGRVVRYEMHDTKDEPTSLARRTAEMVRATEPPR
jgi:hypothetical protein